MGGAETPLSISVAVRRWGLQVTGLAMIAAGAIWAAVALAGGAEIEITKPSGASKSFTITEADYDKRNVKYQEGDEYTPRSGVSLGALLRRVGVGDRAWTSIKVEGLTVQNGSFRPKKPPIFFVRDDELVFYRPEAADDAYETRVSSSLDMDYRVPLVVDESDESPKAGQTVTYEASIAGGGPQSAYDFTWTPSTGTGGSGATFEYTYPESGGEVTINVVAKRSSDNETVGTATLGETVKAPPPSDTGDTGGSGFGSSGFGSGFGSGGFGTTPDFSSPDFSDPNFPDVSPTSPRTPTPEEPKPDDTPVPEVTGTSITGELLSDVGPLPPSSGAPEGSSSTKPEPDEEAETAEEAKDVSAPGALIAGGIIVGLLGLGAGREFEGSGRGLRLKRPDLNALRRLSPPWK